MNLPYGIRSVWQRFKSRVGAYNALFEYTNGCLLRDRYRWHPPCKVEHVCKSRNNITLYRYILILHICVARTFEAIAITIRPTFST